MRAAAKSAFEVTLPRRGELTTRDLRLAFGVELSRLPHVDVIVLSAEGGVPVVAAIELTYVRSGWSRRHALLCPACQRARHLLLARGGKLQCSACHRLRTRRQKERTCSDFVKRGGLEEDRLLRLLLPRWRTMSRVKLVEARLLMQNLLRVDRARAALLRERLQALRMAIEQPA